MTTLATGGTFSASDTTLILRWEQPRRALSTGIWGGGFRSVRWAVNQKLTGFYATEKDFPGGSVAEYLRLSLEEAGADPSESTALLTSARLAWHSHIVKAEGPLIVEAVATAGMEKTAARAGDPPLYREEEGRFCPAGTINLMILVNCSLPDGIMARALITVTEGKTAALQDAGIASVYTGLPATGTATDGVILVTDPEAPRLTDAGTYSLLGSLLASAARDAVAYCITHYKRPWNQFDSLRTPPAVPLPKE